MKKPLIVQKYGGSSLAKPAQIQAAAERVAQLRRGGNKLLVVVSAMGKTTDQLVELAYQVSPTPNRRELDMLLTTGERVSMALMSMALNDRGCPAISFTGSQAGVLTDDSHSNARIVDIKPIRVEAEIANDRVVVLAGFQGVDPKSKEVMTLGRGGSDTTAVAMAAYFKAERCEIRKDVDGVYSADPNQVGYAKHLPDLHYTHLLDMTFWGAKVLHYRSVELASLLGIPLVIALAHGDENGDGRQTMIKGGDAPMYEKIGILSVNSHKDVRWLLLNKPDMNAALQELHALLDTNDLPWPQLLDASRREDQWSLLITAPLETLNVIGTLVERNPAMKLDPRTLSTVTATCQGAYASSLPGEVSQALNENGIRPHQMLFGAMSLTVVVDGKDRDAATRLIHGLYHK